MSNRQPPSNDELEIAEAKNPLTDLLYDYTAQAMTTRVGSYVYHRFDACLAIVEKTAKWSLPQTPPASEEDDTSKMNISPPPLIRPLPWILFLPALIALRLLRVSLSFVALLIGKQPVYPVTMVSFLQSRRRKLRALKYRGQKLQRMKRAEKESEEKAEAQLAASWLQRITLPLRYIICLRAVRPGTSTIHQREHHHHHHHHHRQTGGQSRELTNDAAANEDDGSSRAKPRDEPAAGGCRKRNAHERDADDSESSFEEASVQELLDKYANAEGDSSYHASDSGSSELDSFVSESDKSLTETGAPTEQNDSKKVKKESNGHATPPEKEVASSQKPEESKKKSSLNAVDNNGKPEEKAKPTATAELATENGNAAPQKDQKESQTEASPEPVKAASDTKGISESKPANPSNSAKDQPSSEGNKKSDNSTATKNQSPASTKEVKTNQQQRNKQQQQHQQQHHPNNQQQQQHQPQQQQHHQQQQHQQQQQHHQQQQHQQSTTANGGGGKKHKKPHHQNAQQHH